MEPILEIYGLQKHFGAVKAVNGVSFCIHKGECYGLLGPNGAGKSTTMEIIEQIIPPDKGEILYKGKPIDARYKLEIGVQFQQTALPSYLTVKEALATFCQLYPHSLPLDELIRTCQLSDFIDQRHEVISGGQRQRLLLAVALCSDPHLIILDEPTTGLDPQARRHLWEIVRTIKQQGKTILLTTHYMDEAYELCERIGIMEKGRILLEGTPSDLLHEHQCANLEELFLKLTGKELRD